MPQKLTTTACFLDETGCSGKFLRQFYDYTQQNLNSYFKKKNTCFKQKIA